MNFLGNPIQRAPETFTQLYFQWLPTWERKREKTATETGSRPRQSKIPRSNSRLQAKLASQHRRTGKESLNIFYAFKEAIWKTLENIYVYLSMIEMLGRIDIWGNL